jgi:hypothetical protein
MQWSSVAEQGMKTDTYHSLEDPRQLQHLTQTRYKPEPVNTKPKSLN